MISKSLIIPKPIAVANGDLTDVYKLSAILDLNKVKGKLYKTSFICFQCQSGSNVISEKDFSVNFSAKFCCSNHTPNDCVDTEKQVEDSSSIKGCTRWRVRISN